MPPFGSLLHVEAVSGGGSRCAALNGPSLESRAPVAADVIETAERWVAAAWKTEVDASVAMGSVTAVSSGNGDFVTSYGHSHACVCYIAGYLTSPSPLQFVPIALVLDRLGFELTPCRPLQAVPGIVCRPLLRGAGSDHSLAGP